ncbi:zinc knuckle CX2CX4HX4C containing protein [Tanacetum coccineum]
MKQKNNKVSDNMNGTVEPTGETDSEIMNEQRETDVDRTKTVNGEKIILESEVESVEQNDSIDEGVNHVMDENKVNETNEETTKGISALASRIGKPLVMDDVIASMCKMGVGRVGFARVLVEISAKKPFPYEIEVVYKNEAKEEIRRKTVKVVYDWKPPCCDSCCVFGHITMHCPKTKMEEKVDGRKDTNEEVKNKEGSQEQQPKAGFQKGNLNGKNAIRFAFQPKRPTTNNNVPKEAVEKPKIYDEDEIRELKKVKNREIVENFISQKKFLKESVKKDWNEEMITYYGQRKEGLIDKGNNVSSVYSNESIEIDDIYMDDTGIAQCMEDDGMVGMDGSILNDC